MSIPQPDAAGVRPLRPAAGIEPICGGTEAGLYSLVLNAMSPVGR
jgi:hypothetical protein